MALDLLNPQPQDKTPGGDRGYSLPPPSIPGHGTPGDGTAVGGVPQARPFDWVESGRASDLAAPAVHQRPDWLQIANEANTASDTVYVRDVQPRWMRNTRSFHSQHPVGSKYASADYLYRNKLFIPKSRAMVRASEAANAEAFFATQDVVSITPEDDNDPIQLFGARLAHELLNFHLTRTIPWFLIMQGACQIGEILGIIISKQYWCYRERVVSRELRPVLDPATGMPLVDPTTGLQLADEIISRKVIKDYPVIELIQPEKVRLHQGASWLDPVNTSPYFIERIDSFVCDVEERMETDDPKTGQPPWRKLDRARILQARIAASDMSRGVTQERERGTRSDPAQPNQNQGDASFDMVDVREVKLRWRGEDMHYFTLGSQHLLSEPVPVDQAYRGLPEGERPYVMGYSALEAFRVFPTSKVELVQPLQQATNDQRNLRLDAIALAVSPERFVKPGAGVDLERMRRLVPGKVNLVPDPKAIVWDKPPSVGGESFKEQSMLDSEFDGIAGTFNQASVQANRSLNETVGGMQLVSNESNKINRLDIRTRAESWAEKTLRQTQSLICAHESDPERFRIAGRKAAIEELVQADLKDPMRFAEAAAGLLTQQKFTLRLNVGVGATDPAVQLEAFTKALERAGKVLGAESVAPLLDAKEVLVEIFGKSGYKDGSRFLQQQGKQDPMVIILQKKLEAMQAELEKLMAGHETKLEQARITAAGRVKERQVEGDADVVAAALRTHQEDVPGEQDAAQAVFDRVRSAVRGEEQPEEPEPPAPKAMPPEPIVFPEPMGTA